ncbi:aspartyl-phosphate phosphatase Spo0E family protein [Evansella cellulosilytica]|uniref:Sporulation stage 0, Spo0E-like regulatory phosphatase n=1 Tax=Evansella cellulosilytica (strain ATCC 21833 / DSM 2522 / FERM P-1141 / JCM 9156 / N-4) TaxID=649639 RepID=E6TTB6_EVAC2|nr:aspartyl-phosphate phosphatase Spo0E family protein [Evansella cellulosilytica]ADU28456.1 Sporulation stage 0, Spo0E-like regulatory phosphatase [Evansella cellulosilytica DSM 2522]
MNSTVSKKELLNQIETARDKMNKLSEKMNRTSHEVVEISTHLDDLLIKYQYLSIREKK